ncbi:MAG TPA: CDC48 family AAA ATPase [Methanocella sp.]|uniref:CDC48 family AAA ATPase n=1 Tax=Methanocella sp. TaxID=2052833 RepID=UPI002C8725BD|nr:CDC48 family AAA ATPase [Methanocella sp.]HTY90717.1 CDC48 family AAA ATPase [Methanocella sp.]
MADKNEVTLRVQEAYHRDVGRGIARIDMETMKKLGMVSGDIIEIEGKGAASYAVVWPGYPSEEGKGVILIDGNTRANAKVGIDDRVKVRKIQAKPAERITLAPTQPIRITGGEYYLLKLLEGRPISKGQTIRVEMLGSPMQFIVTSTRPAGAVIADRRTEITISEKPAAEKPEKVPRLTYEDIGGLKREIGLVREMIELPLRHPELFQKLGIDPPKGVLLYGPPGTGKTMIAKAVASETDANFISISGPEIMSKYYGESEKQLRDIFKEAEDNAPSIIFIDEIDSIAPRREEVTGEVERRVVAQLLALMDGLQARGQVIVVAATNRPNAVDPALRRGGRFDREIEIGVPDKNGRLEILHVHTRGMPMAGDVDLEKLASVTHGFVGADLASLAKEAAMHALRTILPEIDIDKEIPQEVMDKLQIKMDDFEDALKNIEPSAMREVFVEVPNVHWSDIGGLESVKQELRETVEWPLKYKDVFDITHTNAPKGILVFGPPGTGKTLLAKAVANESEANFISVKGPEVLSKWVGESEKAVRETFRRARQSAPTIIFFDEIDAIAPTRGASFDSHVTERVVSQLLTELDGLEELRSVVVLAATNRPDMVDTALLRPGRLDRLLYIPPPDEKSRVEIFRIHTVGKPLGPDVDFQALAKCTPEYVGADIEAVCREASMMAIRDYINGSMSPEEAKAKAVDIRIGMKHFDAALKKIKPSASRESMKQYERLAENFARQVTTIEEEAGQEPAKAESKKEEKEKKEKKPAEVRTAS